ERALVHHRIARALVRAGRAGEALGELATAARMLPTDATIVRDLGEAALDAGDLELAERTFRSLVLLRDRADALDAVGLTGVYARLARIAAKKGDARRAAVLLESALERAQTLGARMVALGELAGLCAEDLAGDANLA